jgi:hypothetical protein
MGALTKFFDLLHSTMDKDVAPEENVLLHIRARGLKNQKRHQTFRALLLSLPLVLVIDLFLLPIKLWLTIKTFLFGVLVSAALYLTLDVVTIYYAFIILVFIICIINFFSVTKWVQCLIFDLVDVLTYASLTRMWVGFYFSNQYVHKEYTKKFNYSLISHIFQTRHHWPDTPLQVEEDSFGNKIQSLSDDADQLAFEVDQYWKNQGYE